MTDGLTIKGAMRLYNEFALGKLPPSDFACQAKQVATVLKEHVGELPAEDQKRVERALHEMERRGLLGPGAGDAAFLAHAGRAQVAETVALYAGRQLEWGESVSERLAAAAGQLRQLALQNTGGAINAEANEVALTVTMPDGSGFYASPEGYTNRFKVVIRPAQGSDEQHSDVNLESLVQSGLLDRLEQLARDLGKNVVELWNVQQHDSLSPNEWRMLPVGYGFRQTDRSDVAEFVLHRDLRQPIEG